METLKIAVNIRLIYLKNLFVDLPNVWWARDIKRMITKSLNPIDNAAKYAILTSVLGALPIPPQFLDVYCDAQKELDRKLAVSSKASQLRSGSQQ